MDIKKQDKFRTRKTYLIFIALEIWSFPATIEEDLFNTLTLRLLAHNK